MKKYLICSMLLLFGLTACEGPRVAEQPDSTRVPVAVTKAPDVVTPEPTIVASVPMVTTPEPEAVTPEPTSSGWSISIGEPVATPYVTPAVDLSKYGPLVSEDGVYPIVYSAGGTEGLSSKCVWLKIPDYDKDNYDAIPYYDIVAAGITKLYEDNNVTDTWTCICSGILGCDVNGDLIIYADKIGGNCRAVILIGPGSLWEAEVTIGLSYGSAGMYDAEGNEFDVEVYDYVRL